MSDPNLRDERPFGRTTTLTLANPKPMHHYACTARIAAAMLDGRA